MNRPERILGMNVWRTHWKPRRYQMLAGLLSIAEGLVRVISFGWLMPNWTLAYALYDTRKVLDNARPTHHPTTGEQ